MQQVFFENVERILRLGPAPRHFPRDSHTYARVAAAVCGGLMVLAITSAILAQIT